MRRHLTMEERDRIAQMRHRGFDQKEIALALGRSPATISRELRRNGSGDEYLSGQAQKQAQRRRSERPLVRKMDRPEIGKVVRHGLTHYWSPEQIAGRMESQNDQSPPPISGRTIYTWIRDDAYRDHWSSYLRRRGKRPIHRTKPAGIGDPIAGRPEVIEARLRLGDFEGDTVLGPPGTGGLVTLVDRKSRYTIMIKIQSKDSVHVHRKIKERLKQLDEERRRSVTFDNGGEFARCDRLEKHLDMELYLCEPGRPWQRGTNENTNGLVRQFYPKKTDFREVSHQDVREKENLLNHRPRKCLGYRTPYEVFFGISSPDDCN